jgi:hypothetical protein
MGTVNSYGPKMSIYGHNMNPSCTRTLHTCIQYLHGYQNTTYMVTRTRHTWLPVHYIHGYQNTTYMVTRTLHTWLPEHYIHQDSTLTSSGNRFVRHTGTFGNLIFSLIPSDNRNTRSTCPTSVFTGIGQTLMSRCQEIRMVKVNVIFNDIQLLICLTPL